MGRARPRTKLEVQQLEDRQLLTANQLVLDFTPDRLPGEQDQQAFVDSFLAAGGAEAPRFLDFNKDGTVNETDVRIAVRSIRKRVERYFDRLPIKVRAGDVFADNDFGRRWLRRGQRDRNVYVTVVYVGGSDSYSPNTWGVAYQAPVGRNHEYYAYAYGHSIIDWFRRNAPHASPARFRDEVALTVAHEAGHLMGLGHVKGHPPGIPSVMNYNAPASRARFINRSYEAELVTWYGSKFGRQNPRQELRNSLRGQPDAHWYARYSARERAAHDACELKAPATHQFIHQGRLACVGVHRTAWVDAVLEKGIEDLL